MFLCPRQPSRRSGGVLIWEPATVVSKVLLVLGNFEGGSDDGFNTLMCLRLAKQVLKNWPKAALFFSMGYAAAQKDPIRGHSLIYGLILGKELWKS